MILILDTEVQPDYRYLGPEIQYHTPGPTEYRVFVDDPTLPDLSNVDGIILSGSTASVYNRDRHSPWLDREFELIRQCVANHVPLLGVCFGHQAINVALGGKVINKHRRATFVEMEQVRSDNILDDVSPVVPVLHADLVTELGDEMVQTARTEYNEYFCSRHTTAPVWTVQFHPEFTSRVHDEPSDWDAGPHDFTASNATQVFENFRQYTDEHA